MGATSDGLRVPVALREIVGEIVQITDRFCADYLDTEYASLCRRLARKRPSPLARGDLRIWAAGAIYTVGANNFLFDPSQDPHLRADRLSELVGVPTSTMAGKAKKIRDALGLMGRMGSRVLPTRVARRPSARVAGRGQRRARRRPLAPA